jgi:hypothetical protein
MLVFNNTANTDWLTLRLSPNDIKALRESLNVSQSVMPVTLWNALLLHEKLIFHFAIPGFGLHLHQEADNLVQFANHIYLTFSNTTISCIL